EGTYAVAVVHAGHPGLIVAARRGSPLIAGRAGGTTFVASDIPALLARTKEIYVIGEGCVVEAREGSWRVTAFDGTEVEPELRNIPWDFEAAEKGGFDDFMLKEIHEQPAAVTDTLLGRLSPDGTLQLDELHLGKDALRALDKVFIVGCGTAYHAGLVAKYAIEHWARLPVEIEIASEFRYRDPVLDAQTLVVGVSQSGETLDTMEACRYARLQKARVLAVTNVVDSSLAREADAALYTRAGPEIAVAATKTLVAQVVAMEMLALYLGHLRGLLYPAESAGLFDELRRLPGLIADVLERSQEIMSVARSFAGVRDFFFIGRGVGYPVALEGALKLKEISYLRAEGYPAGELKHGPIALLEPGVVVVGVATKGHLLSKMLSNVEEVRARGATVVLVANPGDARASAVADHLLLVPVTHELFSPAVDVVALQLFAYALGKARGADVDKPRNLAKTVTVE
ncbi:MAG: glutamine--fructose-6-phosphate transaminase (isomerizing), partial [Acidimicrobiales bacterium]